MGVMDRTDEFQQILKGLVTEGEYTLDNIESLKPQEQSQMNVWSGEIGAEIQRASLKVQELRKMAKKKDIYNPRTSEIEELILKLKEDIEGLKKKMELLETKIMGQGPNRTMKVHSSNVVETLKMRLHDVTRDFKDALEERSKSMEKQQQRRQIYNGGRGAASNASLRLQNYAPSANPEDPEEGSHALSQSQIHHNSRAQAVESVQRRIGELAGMMQKCAVMVSAQERMVERIDGDLDEANDNLTSAQEDLLRYFHHISSNRTLIIKIFMILIFFVVFFIVFLA